MKVGPLTYVFWRGEIPEYNDKILKTFKKIFSIDPLKTIPAKLIDPLKAIPDKLTDPLKAIPAKLGIKHLLFKLIHLNEHTSGNNNWKVNF